jgi:Domain of unknown function (DUF6438)
MHRSTPVFLASLALFVSIVVSAAEAPKPAAGKAKAAVRMILDRSVCYGDCPSYRVEIDGDGSVTYEGRKFVAVVGTRRATVARAEVEALLAKFRAARFFDLKDEYRAPVTDLPTFEVTLVLEGRKKTVVDYGGSFSPKYVVMPAVVTELEQAIDRVAQTARWTGKK